MPRESPGGGVRSIQRIPRSQRQLQGSLDSDAKRLRIYLQPERTQFRRGVVGVDHPNLTAAKIVQQRREGDARNFARPDNFGAVNISEARPIGTNSCGKAVWRASRPSRKNDKVTRQTGSAYRTSLAKGEVGTREKKPILTLAQFIDKRFEHWARTTFEKPSP